MLENTFIHLDGIGPKTEQGIWNRGILTWEHFLDHRGILFSSSRDDSIRRQLEDSIRQGGNIRYFLDRLPPTELWRVFDRFKGRAAYLDIETSGGYQGVDEITVIGLYDGITIQTFINGINLEDFEQAVAPFELVVTFNGACFDLPYIRRWFRHISLPPVHIDLRFLLRKLGYRGGLKAIERQFGLARGPEVEGLNGFDAVMLWRAYQWGDQAALKRLVQYNTMDIVHLKPLMETGFREMKSRLLPASES